MSEPLSLSAASGRLSPASVIRADGLRHSYDGQKYALDGVSFTVERGEVFGLLGRNGAGKSTLIKAMTTLIQPSEGGLEILGMDARREGRKIRRRIGVVQQGESFEFATVESGLDIYGRLWGIPREVRQERVEWLIEQFGLGEFRKKRAWDLSGGQKRRVQVAREFIHDMDVLFLDEPTIGLDVVMRRSLLDLIREHVRKGLTVVFTTHNLEEADYLCDRVAVIDRGKFIALDTVAELKRLYGGKQTIDITVGAGDSARFYPALGSDVGDGGTVTVHGSSAILLVADPKVALAKIVALAQRLGVRIEWLTVRPNTLEDVFLRSLEPEGDSAGRP